MDGFTEKKWFVYLGDHHEGPFSLAEIQNKKEHGQVSATNYVWAEGMADWTLMSDVQAFDSILQPIPMPEPVAAGPVAIEATQVFSGGPALAPSGFSAVSIEPLEMAPAAEPVATGPILSAVTNGHGREEPEPAPEQEPEQPRSSKPKASLAGQLVKMGLLLALLGGLGFAYNQGFLGPLLNSQSAQSLIQSAMSTAEPILSKLGISPIPKLDDVDPDDYARLKAAAEARLDQAGPQIAIALSKGDLIDPTFYVAGNLPDGTMLDISIEGVPDTLLNQLSFWAKTQVVITKKFGKTNPLQFSQGHALPRGQYTLYVIDPGIEPPGISPVLAKMPVVAQNANLPKGQRVIGMQSYFLGGLRDAMYTGRLKEFHDKVAAKAQQELAELNQLAATLDSQLTATNQKFAALHKGRRPMLRQKRAWSLYDQSWQKLNQQLGELFSRLTPQALQQDYFYGPLYEMTKQTSDVVNQLHMLQAGYFAGQATDAKAFAIQLGESQASAKQAVDLLKARLDQISKLPPSPSGLPQKLPGT